MEMPFYVDLDIKNTSIELDVHARLLTAIHFRIKAGDILAVSWPRWGSAIGQFGSVLRVFGTESSLKNYLRVVGILAEYNLISANDINTTPNTADRVVFFRDRTMDRYSPSNARRLERRAVARGEVYTPKSRDLIGTHHLKMNSTSNQHAFHMFIKRDMTAIAIRGEHQYGLGIPVPQF